VPADWQSNLFDDPNNALIGGMYMTGTDWMEIHGEGYPYTDTAAFAESELYMRWPLPATANTLTSGNSFWVFSIPKFDVPYVGASWALKSPAGPAALGGRTEVAILDDAVPPNTIARFKLSLSGTTATYSANGETLCTVKDAAELCTYGDLNLTNSYVYKYGNSSEFYDVLADIPDHSLTIIGKANGSLAFSLSAANTPEINGAIATTSTVSTHHPTWVEFRVTEPFTGCEGLGAIRIPFAASGGGIYWDTYN